VLGPGETCHVLARGPEGDTLELVRDDDGFTVYAWPGSVVQVILRGNLAGIERLTAPWLPDGMRTREWVEALDQAL
jgi:hypothetical protein